MYFDLGVVARVVGFLAGVEGALVGAGASGVEDAGDAGAGVVGVATGVDVDSGDALSVALAGLTSMRLDANMLHAASATSGLRKACFDIFLSPKFNVVGTRCRVRHRVLNTRQRFPKSYRQF